MYEENATLFKHLSFIGGRDSHHSTGMRSGDRQLNADIQLVSSTFPFYSAWNPHSKWLFPAQFFLKRLL